MQPDFESLLQPDFESLLQPDFESLLQLDFAQLDFAQQPESFAQHDTTKNKLNIAKKMCLHIVFFILTSLFKNNAPEFSEALFFDVSKN